MAAQEKNTGELEKAKQLNHVPWSEEYEKMISATTPTTPASQQPASKPAPGHTNITLTSPTRPPAQTSTPSPPTASPASAQS
ncbi:hypothetical protein P171DRAFT_106610 [Karstenula rhodostoma CBS 690.94]|uniref:Uncharacterized protein n=1 Tax=Karstenula rhodostoma CBS 690.94 TaxID=1392251 RepID=A0A9P4PB76_9PLEO|nr:hypothetical protein P171DRAFT_106610 [Karstenula rhodostoma CBS 690.94]